MSLKVPFAYIVLGLSLLLPFRLLADKVDSLQARHDTMLVRYFYYHTDSLDMGKLYRQQTSRLQGFQRYEVTSRTGFRTTLGNVGLANQSMIFRARVYEGFYFDENPFDIYRFNNENSRYYIHNRPVSYISYFNGPKKEQHLRAMLSHKIFRAVTVAADFSLINAPGIYYQQKSNDRSLLLTSQYYTEDKRFGLIANYTWNKFIVSENGGIMNDSVFELNLESDRALIDVNLPDAENLVKESGGYLNAYFFLSKKGEVDSLNGKPKTFHAGRISYTVNYNNKSRLYTDTEPLSDFYQPYGPPLDTNETRDSLHLRTLENSFSWSNLRLGEEFANKFLYVGFGLKHQYVELTGYADKRMFTQLIPTADLRIHPFSVLTLGGHGHYVVGDFNNNGYLLRADGKLEVSFRNDVRGILHAEFGFASQEPGYFYSFYQSNYFRWATSFQHQKFRWFGATLAVWKFKVGARYTSVSRYAYLGADSHPAQYEGNIDILQLTWNQDFRWSVWNMDLEVIYQAASQSAIHLPALAGRAALYATVPLFKNAAMLQPGFDFFYNSDYYSDAYMPALRSFYWQDEKQTGNYLYADVFLSLLVKRFRVFVKYEHLNSLWTKSRYYMVPHYPSHDASFKWGMSWSFYD